MHLLFITQMFFPSFDFISWTKFIVEKAKLSHMSIINFIKFVLNADHV